MQMTEGQLELSYFAGRSANGTTTMEIFVCVFF